MHNQRDYYDYETNNILNMSNTQLAKENFQIETGGLNSGESNNLKKKEKKNHCSVIKENYLNILSIQNKNECVFRISSERCIKQEKNIQAPKILYVQETEKSKISRKYLSEKITKTYKKMNKYNSAFESVDTNSNASMNKNLISSHLTFDSMFSKKSTNDNTQEVTKEKNTNPLSIKTSRLPLRHLLDSGEISSLVGSKTKALNAYIISEKHQEKLIIREKSQQQLKQRELYKQFKSKRSSLFSRRMPLASQSFSNPSFLIAQNKK